MQPIAAAFVVEFAGGAVPVPNIDAMQRKGARLAFNLRDGLQELIQGATLQ
jgi:hypothetical protein